MCAGHLVLAALGLALRAHHAAMVVIVIALGARAAQGSVRPMRTLDAGWQRSSSHEI